MIVTACRDGAECIPGFVKSLRWQNDPPPYRLFLIADHCLDDSAAVARDLGMDVYEHQSPGEPGKGNAVNALLQQIKTIPFDVLIVLDIDARVEPTFLERAARHFRGDACVVSCSTFAKNPDESLWSRVGTLIQALLRGHQEGRAAWGWDAMLYGSHGYALSRPALDRLGWHTTTGLVAEDMELRLRAILAGIPVNYAADLPVYNDVTADARSVHQQRLRWNATYPPLIFRYAGPLLRRRHWDALFAALLQPAFANLFLFLSLTAALVGGLSAWFPMLRSSAVVVLIMWITYLLYFLAAFKVQGVVLRWLDIRGFIQHLTIRAAALVEGFFWVRTKDWRPAPHSGANEK